MTLSRKSGFTLVEMMVAVGILGVVVAGAMQTFVVQNHAYTVVDETTEAQQNLRAISYLLERDLRVTSFMLPEGSAACGIDNTNAPDTLYVTDSEPINPVGQSSAGLYATILSGYSAADTLQTLVVNKVTLDGQAYFDNDANGTPDSDFRIGGGAIVFAPATPSRGTACGIVKDVSATQVRIEFATHLTLNTGPLAVVPAIVYSVDVNDNLLRNGVTLATDVDDLQFAYFIDANANGVVDANEYRGEGGSAAYLSRGATALPTDHSKLREIRFDVVVRSRTTDPTYTEGFVQSTENRGAVGGNDGFRRRVFTSTVRQRNIGYRGVQPPVG
ncbi:MAG: PilW family protein [Proteobacteria bacterium]|nr:PilW family protein [Pseudomonadota bacterium]